MLVAGMFTSAALVKKRTLMSGHEANINCKPVVFDPVAVGATSFRSETSKGKSSFDWQ